MTTSLNPPPPTWELGTESAAASLVHETSLTLARLHYSEELDYHSSQSEPYGALGHNPDPN